MRTLGSEARKAAAVILAGAAMIGGVIGWCLGELIDRHDSRRRY